MRRRPCGDGFDRQPARDGRDPPLVGRGKGLGAVADKCGENPNPQGKAPRFRQRLAPYLHRRPEADRLVSSGPGSGETGGDHLFLKPGAIAMIDARRRMPDRNRQGAEHPEQPLQRRAVMTKGTGSELGRKGRIGRERQRGHAAFGRRWIAARRLAV